jgi:hypothetical protein
MGERIKGDLLDHVTRTVYGKRIRQKLQVCSSAASQPLQCYAANA